ncbi:hypothetical protein TNCV_1414771 [Trichonephila clavipes]|nr:hypothetical protein TNCV_1414771 [Trichonephila clavipes]
MSARYPLLDLLLTQNHRRLRRHWCDERRTWVEEWNEFVFTDESRICLQRWVGFESRDTVERGCWEAAICTATLVLYRELWYGSVLVITLALF